MFFEDESTIISYYTVDNTGACVEYYSFGLYIDAQGRSRWLPRAELSHLRFDNDDLPKTWKLEWANQEIKLEVDITVRDTSISKAWGAWGTPNVPKERRDFVLIPLVLDGVATIKTDNIEQTLWGYGLAEYWRML
jgi:hypothetical protein